MADDEKSALGALWDSLSGRAKKELAKRAVESAANGVLDDIERALLGKEGAADEILAKDTADGDALDRLRRSALADRSAPAGRAAVPEPAAPTKAPTAADREAKARLELAEMKRKLGKS